jgi:hypothetical protein
MTDEEQQFSDLCHTLNSCSTKSSRRKKILIGPPASTPKTPTRRRVASAKPTPRQSRLGRRTSRRRSGMLPCKHALHATTTLHFWLPPLPASKESSVKLLPILFSHQLSTPEKLSNENSRVAESLVVRSEFEPVDEPEREDFSGRDAYCQLLDFSSPCRCYCQQRHPAILVRIQLTFFMCSQLVLAGTKTACCCSEQPAWTAWTQQP